MPLRNITILFSYLGYHITPSLIHTLTHTQKTWITAVQMVSVDVGLYQSSHFGSAGGASSPFTIGPHCVFKMIWYPGTITEGGAHKNTNRV